MPDRRPTFLKNAQNFEDEIYVDEQSEMPEYGSQAVLMAQPSVQNVDKMSNSDLDPNELEKGLTVTKKES